VSIRISWKAGLALAAALALTACGGGGSGSDSGSAPDTASAADAPLADAPVRTVQQIALPGGRADVLDARLSKASGSVDVWVTLDDAPVAAAAAQLAIAASTTERTLSVKTLREAPQATREALATHRKSVLSHQDALQSRLSTLGARELGRVHMAHNAIAVRVDASQLKAIAALPGVAKVRRVNHYEMSLSETVPYIGATAAQQAGADGTGVRVAVLDSGIDYTHRNLGGAGTPEAYLKAYGTDPSDARNTTIDPSVFPTAKVVGGFDFVGDVWPNGPRTEDPNPIDFQGHGTHVADIIGGKSLDGTHKGVAPGAKLLAVRVCSAVATSCNGVAILKGLDWALDPNGDGDTSDAVDVVNLSLGSDYGQVIDDSTEAISTVVDAGIVAVVAAGNAANKPYIVSSPSIAPGAISVAQTQVPSAVAFGLKINSPASIAGTYGNTATVDWAPIAGGFSGDVVFVGTACPGEALLANPAGKVALIDRGACSISLKVDAAGAAGATGVLLGLVAPGDAVSFSNGGGTHFVPTLVITQATSNKIKANIAAPVNVTVSDGTKVPLAGSMASTSARGPSISYQTIKPEIGAPGASVSAVAGSATGEEAFGGTSGATPMIAGSAAILIGKYPNRTPLQIKSMLMNSAMNQIYTNPALLPGVLAPITRIGAGEVRVNKALALNAIAYEPTSLSAALSFGAHEVSAPSEYEKKLVVENFGTTAKTFAIKSAFRFADDQASGAVTISAPSSVKVAAGGRQTITVKLRVNPAKLPEWTLDSGAQGGSGDLLDAPEYDGYLTLTAGTELLSVPWHILPRKAAQTLAVAAIRPNWPGGIILMGNVGAADSEFDIFALTGTSKKADPSELPQPGDNFAFVDMRAIGVRYVADGGALQFALSTFGRRATANYPAGFEVDIDVDRDGVPDFAVYNAEQGGFGATGINLINVVNLATGVGGAYYYADADFNSANMIMTVPLAALGLTPDQQFDFTASAADNYYTGNVTDAFDKMTFTPAKPRYAVNGDSSGIVRSLRIQRVDTLTPVGGATASPSQTGFLVMLRREAGTEAQVIVAK
jgi:hypothetical protein